MNWELMGPPLGVILCACAVAYFLVGSLKDERSDEAKLREEKIRALLAEKEAVVSQLKGFDVGAGSDEERDACLARGREILIELEAMGHKVHSVVPKRGELKRLTLVLSLAGLLFGAVTIYLVFRESEERVEETQNQSMRPVDVTEEVKAQMEILEKNPEDLDALKYLTRRALLDQDPKSAMGFFMRAEGLKKDDVDLQVYASGLAILVGMADRAFPRLEQVLMDQPDHVEAHWWNGLAHASMRQFEDASVSLKKCISLSPQSEEAYYAQMLLKQIQQESTMEIHASGSVEIRSSVVVPEGGVLYVAALRAPVSGGPPLAAARFPTFSSPHAFALSDANMPMGGEWPDQFWMRVRIDADGDPMTKSDADVKTDFLGTFERGQKNIEVQLGE